ncbi:MAG: Nramp family divalent metal transporter [Candidatus Levybacteria bacterium]|nr:Nramp family divalent metal transporter [Candidatus Levybacteria bacterium]
MKKIKKLLKILGPGFITGSSDDDPSGIATYAQTGSIFGYTQLWTALFSFPFMTLVQEMCGRIGVVTGNGLAGVIKAHYSKKVLYIAVGILFFANTINIGANLGAMASAGQLLLGIPFLFWLVILTLVTILLEIFVSYPVYARFLKFLTFSLFAYFITTFVVKQDWGAIATSTFIPTISFQKEYLMNIVAILGTTISPYLFFWEADEEVEEEIESHKIKAMGKGIPRISKKDITNMRLDTVIGMLFSNLVMFFIIITAASTLHVNGITHIETADQAALALKPIAGDFASLLFAVGILGTGFLAVPILAGSASYAISEALKWNAGLSKSFTKARGFYAVIALATLLGFAINFTSIKPFTLLYYTAILNGISAPPLLLLILLISNNKKIMKNHTNSLFSNIGGIIIIIIMTASSIALASSLL